MIVLCLAPDAPNLLLVTWEGDISELAEMYPECIYFEVSSGVNVE